MFSRMWWLLLDAEIASTRKNPFRHTGKHGVTDCIAVVIWIGFVQMEKGGEVNGKTACRMGIYSDYKKHD